MLYIVSKNVKKEAKLHDFGAVLYKEGLTFDSIYKLADKGVYDSKTNKGNSCTFPK